MSLIDKIKDCINTELGILQHVTQCKPMDERENVNKMHIIKQTKESIDRLQEILNKLTAKQHGTTNTTKHF